MQVTRLNTVEAYAERLRREPQEVAALFRDLLINVTNFFRDEDAFEALAKSVIPELFEGRGADDVVRIWVPGCATGEEVFSIAILAREHMNRLSAVPRVQIFATDIDEQALSVARAARYPAALLSGVSAERRDRFFILDGGSYVLSKDVRELCIFSPHSIIRDPPFSRIDLVSCRNSADLSRRGRPKSGRSHVLLRAAAGRLSVPRLCGERQPVWRPVRAARQAASDLPTTIRRGVADPPAAEPCMVTKAASRQS